MRGFLSERGQSLVEMALTAPLLILFLVGILDLGRVVYTYTMLSAAAQQGARAGAVSENYAAIEGAVRSKLLGVDANSVTISIDRTEEYADVELLYNFIPVTPLVADLIGGGSIPLRQGARMRVLGAIYNP